MKRIGIVRLENFKRMATAIKKALRIKHAHALTTLATACGMGSYEELRTLVMERAQSIDQLLPGSNEERLETWREQLADAFDADVEEALGLECLQKWFKRVFAARAGAGGERLVEENEPAKPIRDPGLDAGNWRDAEFRRWIRQLVDAPKRAVEAKDWRTLGESVGESQLDAGPEGDLTDDTEGRFTELGAK
jgi:HPt (histidine-containing phosphotransfer) domain-containing protein